MSRKLIICCALLASGLTAFAAAGVGTVISQKDKTFSEKEITIKPGEAVTFKNDDTVAHNVFSSTAGMEFNLKNQAPGSESAQTFDKEGDCEIRCAIHPKMKLTVHVKK
jgi:plastocyanin